MTTAHIVFDKTSDKVAGRVKKMRSSAVRDLFSAATSGDVISLSGGMPDVSLLPVNAIRKATKAATEDQRAVALEPLKKGGEVLYRGDVDKFGCLFSQGGCQSFGALSASAAA